IRRLHIDPENGSQAGPLKTPAQGQFHALAGPEADAMRPTGPPKLGVEQFCSPDAPTILRLTITSPRLEARLTRRLRCDRLGWRQIRLLVRAAEQKVEVPVRHQ